MRAAERDQLFERIRAVIDKGQSLGGSGQLPEAAVFRHGKFPSRSGRGRGAMSEGHDRASAEPGEQAAVDLSLIDEVLRNGSWPSP